jgi:protein-S-isoprenylcysteine O-methyltransferase Ste14
MAAESSLLANRAVAAGSALIYWVGVFIQARRIRHRIGRAPNVKPRGRKEKLLWVGWFSVVLLWLGIPFVAGRGFMGFWGALFGPALSSSTEVLGILSMAAGYTGTLFCYAAMGEHWRMGIDRSKRTTLATKGPYRYIRHPIYFFQIVMLLGLVLLLPTLLSLIAIFVHVVCVRIKIADEEAFLLSTLGKEYSGYQARTGKLLPKLGKQ